MKQHTAGSHARYGDRDTRPLALSLGLNASPSTDMEATLAIPETLKKSATSGWDASAHEGRVYLQVFRSVPSSKYSQPTAKDEES